jgi:hypothetical protein
LVQIKNVAEGPGYVVANIEDLEDDLPEVAQMRRVILTKKEVIILDDRTLEFIERGTQPPIWNSVLIVRIRQEVADKRSAAIGIHGSLEKVTGVESVRSLRAWETGLGWRQLRTANGREFLLIA